MSRKPESKHRDWTRQFLDIAGVIILVVDVNEKVSLVNRKGSQVLGYSPSELKGKNWFDLCIPERLRSEVRRLFHDLLKTGAEHQERYFEHPVLTRDGQERLVAWRNTVLLDEDGAVIGTLSSGEDVTDSRQREASLQSREAELRAIVDTAVDGILTIDANGTVRSFNAAATRLFGYQPEDVIGKNVSVLMPEPDSFHHNAYVTNYLHTGEAQIIGIGREVHGRRKDGSTFPLYLSVSETRLPDRLLFTGIVHDMTVFRRLQEELLQSKNLAAIGEMAATVAHEIKNPLAGISGAIHVLRDTLDKNDPRRDIMGEIIDQVNRLDETVRQLLMLSKPWKPSRQSCDLPKLLRQLTTALQEEKQFSHIRFQVEGEEQLKAQIDPSLVQQVLVNLIQNSAQAIQGEGSVTLTVKGKGEAAELTITDSGPGIAPQVKDRLFQPFVTTKAHGTGLGLAICKKIMEAHGGSITISSGPQNGTQVTLHFPPAPARRGHPRVPGAADPRP